MNFSLWSFRFLLWYVCVLLVQPQNRFTFLWPLHIADISFILAIISCLSFLSVIILNRLAALFYQEQH